MLPVLIEHERTRPNWLTSDYHSIVILSRAFAHLRCANVLNA